MATVRSFNADVSSVSPSSERMEFHLSTHLITLNYPVTLSHRRSTSVSLETYPLYLTYRFSNLDQCDSPGSWSEDKFFKLLLFRNLHRQQGKNTSKTFINGFIWFLLVLYIDLKHSESKCRHLIDCFINMINWAIMMREFRYLRVTESSTDWFASCNLLTDGVYMKYMKITKEIKEKNEIPKRKTTGLSVLLFFNRLKPTSRHYCENHSHLQTKYCI